MTHQRQLAVETILSAVTDETPLPPGELHGALTALGLTGEETARETDRILGAQREHARLRRRERELAALFSSARELAELRDIDAVLQRLVERALAMMVWTSRTCPSSTPPPASSASG